MSLDTSKISERVLEDLYQRLEFPDHKNGVVWDQAMEEISKLSSNEAFTEWCNWHGLIHWGGELINVLGMLRDAEGEFGRYESKVWKHKETGKWLVQRVTLSAGGYKSTYTHTDSVHEATEITRLPRYVRIEHTPIRVRVSRTVDQLGGCDGS